MTHQQMNAVHCAICTFVVTFDSYYYYVLLYGKEVLYCFYNANVIYLSLSYSFCITCSGVIIAITAATLTNFRGVLLDFIT